MNNQLADKFFMIMEDLKKNVFGKNRLDELSKSEFSMLHVIKQCEREVGYVTTSELSELLQITKPATSQMINVLEDKQYIQRIINKEDRRLMCVAMTELGNSVIEKQNKIFRDRVSLVFDKMGKQDSELFVELLGKYVSIFKQIMT